MDSKDDNVVEAVPVDVDLQDVEKVESVDSSEEELVKKQNNHDDDEEEFDLVRRILLLSRQCHAFARISSNPTVCLPYVFPIDRRSSPSVSGRSPCRASVRPWLSIRSSPSLVSAFCGGSQSGAWW